MPGAPGTFVTLTGTGSTTYAASGRARYDLSQLASLGGPGPRRSYLRKIIVACDVTWNNTNAANRVLTWQKMYDAIKRVSFFMPGHQFIDFPFTGGQSLRYLHYVQTGRQPEWQTSLTLAQNVTQNSRLKFHINCFDPRQINPEEDMLPLGILLGGALELDWANGAATEFGADVSISAATLRVSAEIVQRDETRWPALWTHQERNQSALSDFISPDGVIYKDVHLIGVAAQGIAAPSITNANVTAVTLTQNGQKTHDAQAPAEIVSIFNDQEVTNSADYLAQPESGNAELLPLVWFPRSGRKRSHFVPELSKPYLQLTGTLAVANARLLLSYVKPTGPRTVADLAARQNERLPDGFQENPRQFVAPKGESKQPVGPAKGAFIAQKLYRGGTGGR